MITIVRLFLATAGIDGLKWHWWNLHNYRFSAEYWPTYCFFRKTCRDVYVQCHHLRVQPGHNTRPHAHCHPIPLAWMHARMATRLNVSLILKQSESLFLDMLSLGVCTTRHWQMSGRLVQGLNVCTVQHVTKKLSIAKEKLVQNSLKKKKKDKRGVWTTLNYTLAFYNSKLNPVKDELL